MLAVWCLGRYEYSTDQGSLYCPYCLARTISARTELWTFMYFQTPWGSAVTVTVITPSFCVLELLPLTSIEPRSLLPKAKYLRNGGIIMLAVKKLTPALQAGRGMRIARRIIKSMVSGLDRRWGPQRASLYLQDCTAQPLTLCPLVKIFLILVGTGLSSCHLHLTAINRPVFILMLY